MADGDPTPACFGGTRLVLLLGDITTQQTDGIVNAANSGMLGGGGVDGAINRVGGPGLVAERRAWVKTHGRLPAGEATVTGGGALPARRVVHTVGPVWQGGAEGEPEILAKAYRNSIRAARAAGLRTLAFPSLSTGAYGYPLQAAAQVALRAVRDELESEPGTLDEVRFVLFSRSALAAYEEVLRWLAER